MKTQANSSKNAWSVGCRAALRTAARLWLHAALCPFVFATCNAIRAEQMPFVLGAALCAIDATREGDVTDLFQLGARGRKEPTYVGLFSFLACGAGADACTNASAGIVESGSATAATKSSS